jgi:hypothetical protein
VRFALSDKAADERVHFVELDRERVVLRRAVRGMQIAVNVPLAAYLGVAVRIEPPVAGDPGAVAVVLEHSDPALSLTLYRAADGNDIVAEWQLWARALQLPLLVADADGSLREPFARIGALRVGAAVGRRRRRSAIKRRRPAFLLRRKVGDARASSVVHRGEREIIARN